MNRPIWLVLAFLLASSAHAQAPKQGSSLLTHDQLQARLTEPKSSANLRLLDVRPRADYDKGHIPGAVWVDAKLVSRLLREREV